MHLESPFCTIYVRHQKHLARLPLSILDIAHLPPCLVFSFSCFFPRLSIELSVLKVVVFSGLQTPRKMNASLVLLLAMLPLAAAMTPQWSGLVNGTLIYLVLGAAAMCFVVCVSKQAKPCVALPCPQCSPTNTACALASLGRGRWRIPPRIISPTFGLFHSRVRPCAPCRNLLPQS